MIIRSRFRGCLFGFIGLIILTASKTAAQVKAQDGHFGHQDTALSQKAQQADVKTPELSVEHATQQPEQQKPLNGSLILEDLVNQFIERNRAAVGRELDLEPTSGESPSRRPVERASGEPPAELQSDELKLAENQEQAAGEWSTSRPEVSDELAAAVAAIASEAQDRHIQYDVVPERVTEELQPAHQAAKLIAPQTPVSKPTNFTTEQQASAEPGTEAGTGSGQRIGQARAIGVSQRVSSSQLTRPPYASHDQFGAKINSAQEQERESLLGTRAGSRQQELNESHEDAAESRQAIDDGQLKKLANSQVVELSPLPINVDEQSAGSGVHFYAAAKEPAKSMQHRSSPNKSLAIDRFVTKEPANDDQQPLTERQLGPKEQQSAAKLIGTGSVLLVSAGDQTADGRYLATNLQANNQEFESSNAIGEQPASRFTPSDERPATGNAPQGHLLLVHRVAPPSHYAASLVNVTAPMVLPLSASEAMESALGGDQAAKSLLHQVSGLLRPTSLELAQAQASRQSQSQRFGSTEQMISPPANQLPASGNSTLSDKDKQSATNTASRRQASFSQSTPQPTGGLSQVTPLHQASGFRSPVGHYSSGSHQFGSSVWPTSGQPSAYLSGSSASSLAATVATTSSQLQQQASQISAAQLAAGSSQMPTSTTRPQVSSTVALPVPTNSSSSASVASTSVGFVTGEQSTGASLSRRQANLTRVEHISAECSNDLIRSTIVFNGTFKGIIYSAGYVRDQSCLYVNGTGKSRYEFSIRLNQCGTLGRQELHQERAQEIRRRDHLMWNTLSIQYNPMIEQEWDEHFRVSCEYGSDFWKTVSFSPFNVETNTGAPVVFTVDPPKCQMEVLRGHGMVGPRQEVVSGPVTVGDPLTLLIHMKSEKAGYDILVKNCIAHNGGHQKMQLIDANGCVVNERFISPFRGTYNDNDLKHVTLYSYLKAFRFTGSPVLYLECEIHMCQSSCPPQMCYWRRLSKRSIEGQSNATIDQQDHEDFADLRPLDGASVALSTRQTRATPTQSATTATPPQSSSDKMSLFQAIEVRHERPSLEESDPLALPAADLSLLSSASGQLCYRKSQFVGILLVGVSLLSGALTLALGCCWRASRLAAGRVNQQSGELLVPNQTHSYHSPTLLATPTATNPHSSQLGQQKRKSSARCIESAETQSQYQYHQYHHHQQQQPKRLLLCDY